MLKVAYTQSMDSQEFKHCYYSVATDIIHPEVCTVAHVFFQGRVVVTPLDLGWNKMVPLGLLRLEWVGRGFASS